MPKVVVLGYGNPLRGDDAIGWLAATELQRRLEGQQVHVVAAQQLNPEHAELVAEAELAIFIDASAETEGGTVTQSVITPIESGGRSFTHNITPQVLLTWAYDWFHARPNAVLFTMGATNFECGELSEPVSRMMPRLVEEVAAACINHARVGTLAQGQGILHALPR